jgi:cytochrome c553
MERDFIKISSVVCGLVLYASAAAGANLGGKEIANEGIGDRVPPCTNCHGAQLQGRPAINAPPLAGLKSSFVLARLAHYAGPKGHNASMRHVASAMTVDERRAVADYIQGLPPVHTR